jgi:membrane-bound serine protease (ClpP class)
MGVVSSVIDGRTPLESPSEVWKTEARRSVKSAAVCATLVCFALCFALVRAADAAEPVYVELRLDGIVNPLKVRHLGRAFDRAEREQARFILLTIDTPGGLVSSLQELTVAITNSKVPVVGFVEPESAQATSAGAFLLLATDVAAMAPSTRVGAAHPVADGKPLEGVMDAKVTNSLASHARSLAERRGRPPSVAESMVRESKSFTEKEARAAGLVEILAANRAELLRALDGRKLDFRGKPFVFETKRLRRVEVPMSTLDRVLDTIANPTLASLLLTIGVLGLLYELSSPGIGLGGVVGAICVVVGLLGVSVLPIELGGILLLVVGLAAIGLEMKVPTHGLLAAGGVVSLVLGAMFLIDSDDYFGGVGAVNVFVFAPLIAVAAGGLSLLARLTRRALAAPFVSGESALIGKRGVVKSTFVAEGNVFSGGVFVDGARWQGSADAAIAEGEPVEVVAVLRNPMRLRVKRAGT